MGTMKRVVSYFLPERRLEVEGLFEMLKSQRFVSKTRNGRDCESRYISFCGHLIPSGVGRASPLRRNQNLENRSSSLGLSIFSRCANCDFSNKTNESSL